MRVSPGPKSEVDDLPPEQAPRFPDEEVVRCVVARFKRLQFDRPVGGIVTVIYPLVFEPKE